MYTPKLTKTGLICTYKHECEIPHSEGEIEYVLESDSCTCTYRADCPEGSTPKRKAGWLSKWICVFPEGEPKKERRTAQKEKKCPHGLTHVDDLCRASIPCSPPSIDA